MSGLSDRMADDSAQLRAVADELTASASAYSNNDENTAAAFRGLRT